MLKTNLFSLLKFLNILKLIICFDGYLKPVTKYSNGATCRVSSGYEFPSDAEVYPCENALEPYYIRHQDWAASCTRSTRLNSWIEITLKKTYHIVEFTMAQRRTKENSLLVRCYITLGNLIKKAYHLSSDKISFLLEENMGKNTNKILIQPQAYKGSEGSNIGYNYILAYAYDDGKSFFFSLKI